MGKKKNLQPPQAVHLATHRLIVIDNLIDYIDKLGKSFITYLKGILVSKRLWRAYQYSPVFPSGAPGVNANPNLTVRKQHSFFEKQKAEWS